MRPEPPSSPHEAESASEAEEYPVWKRWGDLDASRKSSASPAPRTPPSRQEGTADGSPSWGTIAKSDERSESSTHRSDSSDELSDAGSINHQAAIESIIQRTRGAGVAAGKVGEASAERAAQDARSPVNGRSDSPSPDTIDGPAEEPVANGRSLADDHPHDERRSWEDEFSVLDIRDRVVIMLLFKQVVQIEEVEAAWRRFQRANQGRSRQPLWRILAGDPAFDRDRILAEAAKTSGFDEAPLDPEKAVEFMKTHASSFAESEWERMLSLRVLPVGREESRKTGRVRFVFVAPDPTRPGVAKLLRDLHVGSNVLRYVPESTMEGLFDALSGRSASRPSEERGMSPESGRRESEPADPSSAEHGSPESDSSTAELGSPDSDPPDAELGPPMSDPPVADSDQPSRARPEPKSDRGEVPSAWNGEAPSASNSEAPPASNSEAPPPEAGARPPLQPPARQPVPAGSGPTPVSQDEAVYLHEARTLFEECLSEAVGRKARGIHLLPVDEGLQIDMRIGGALERWQTCSRTIGDELLAVVKDSALNIRPAEIDAVQDGLIIREMGGVAVRFSVSVLPIAGGWSDDRRESVVISILGNEPSSMRLDELGLPEEVLRHLREAIAEPRGMVILAGPSGSGRSTTLRAILNEIVTPKVNVITLEDSVSHEAQGVRQVRLSSKLDHEDALDAVRRHDPDVILVGELRTKETAELALKLANAGHLVFSRLPAHDATGVIGRLFRLEVDPFLIAYAVNLIVAQRLVRRLCIECRAPAKHVDGELLRRLGFSRQEIASTTFYGEGSGAECSVCGGRFYHGTQIIAEAMPFGQETRRLIALADGSFDEEDARAHAVRQGMTTIRTAARNVVLSGETSVDEMIRATAGGS